MGIKYNPLSGNFDYVTAKTVSGDIDHNLTINTHNLTTSINHNTILNNHNLTTDISHDSINSGTIVSHDTTATGTNLTELTNGSTTTLHNHSVSTNFVDNQFSVFNVTDNTKILNFDVSTVSTSTTRTLIIPDLNGTIALMGANQSTDFITSGTITAGTIAAAAIFTNNLQVDNQVTSALIPDQPFNYNLGESGNEWDMLYVSQVIASSTGQFDSGLVDSSTFLSINLTQRFLLADNGTNIILDYSTIGEAEFGDSSITTTGLGTFGNLDVDTLNFNGNVISDSTGTISFDDDNLSTTGNIEIVSDSSLMKFGLARDGTIGFDGNSLNIVANAVTSGDFINLDSPVKIGDFSFDPNFATSLTQLRSGHTSMNNSSGSTKTPIQFDGRITTGGSAQLRNVFIDTRYQGSQNQTGQIQAFQGQIFHTGTGNTGSSIAMRFELTQATNASASNFIGVQVGGSIANTKTGTVTVYRAFYDTGMDAEDGTVVVAYGFYSTAHRVDTGSLSQAYGARFEKQTAGSTNAAIWISGSGIGADIRFGSSNRMQIYTDGTNGIIDVVNSLRIGNDVTNYMSISSTGIMEPVGAATYKARGGNAGITQSETSVNNFDVVIEDGLITSFIKNS